MRIILAKCGNGYVGCESEETFFFDNDVSDAFIDEEILCWARENTESFAYVHFGWDEEYTDEDYEDYLENYTQYDWHEATYEEYVEYCENWSIEPRAKEELEVE